MESFLFCFATVANDTRAHLIANNRESGDVTPPTFQDQGSNDKRIDWLVLHHGNDFVILNLNSDMTAASEDDYIVALRESGGTGQWVFPVSSDSNSADPYEMTASQVDLDEMVAVITGGGTLDVIIFDNEVSSALPGWRSGTLTYDDPEELSMSAQAGNPAASFNLSALGPPAQQLSMSASAGNPTAAFDLDALKGGLQTLSLGSNVNLATGWTGALALDSELVGNAATGWLRSVHIYRFDATTFFVAIGLSQTETGDINVSGPNFNGALEAYDRAIRLSEIGGSSIVIAGPNAAGNTLRDDSEPYAYEPANSDALETWVGNLGNGEVTIRFSDDDIAPVADAGDDQRASGGTFVTLDGSGSFDPDGTIVLYRWVQVSGPGATIVDGFAAVTQFVPPHSAAEETYVFRLSVTDDSGKRTSDTVTFTVAATHQLAMSARAGDPTAAFNVLAIAPGVPAALAMSARAGDPTAAFNLSAFGPVVASQLAMSARAGNPMTALSLRSFVPPAYKIEATADLLIGQWKEAATLNRVVEIFLEVVQEEIVDAVNRLQLMGVIETAEGVWLDYIGERLGIIRPWILITTDERFGFDDAGVGFDQARFADAISALEPRAPIGDMLFRQILKARRRLMRTGGGIGDYEAAIQELDSAASVVDNHDMTVTVTTTQQGNIEIAERVGAIVLPAGVGRTFA